MVSDIFDRVIEGDVKSVGDFSRHLNVGVDLTPFMLTDDVSGREDSQPAGPVLGYTERRQRSHGHGRQ